MKISDIIIEGPAEKVGQAVGQAAFNVGKVAGKTAAAVEPAAANAKAIGRGAKSGIWKWATGQSQLAKDSSATSSSEYDTIQSIIDQDSSVSKSSIQKIKDRLPTMKLNWSADRNLITAALDQALADKPLDSNQINSLKTLQKSLKKV